MARYRLTHVAESDLEGIWQYTHEAWGTRQASKYLRQLKRRIEELARKPRQGRLREDISPGLLSYHEGRHLISYRMHNEGIAILRVLHDRMGVPERLTEVEE